MKKFLGNAKKFFISVASVTCQRCIVRFGFRCFACKNCSAAVCWQVGIRYTMGVVKKPFIENPRILFWLRHLSTLSWHELVLNHCSDFGISVTTKQQLKVTDFTNYWSPSAAVPGCFHSWQRVIDCWVHGTLAWKIAFQAVYSTKKSISMVWNYICCVILLCMSGMQSCTVDDQMSLLDLAMQKQWWWNWWKSDLTLAPWTLHWQLLY